MAEQIALNCDCMEYMRTVPDKYFDLACVDPPYGDASQSVNAERADPRGAEIPQREGGDSEDTATGQTSTILASLVRDSSAKQRNPPYFDPEKRFRAVSHAWQT